MDLTDQEVNFVIILVVAIIGIGIPLYVCCFALLRTNFSSATSASELISSLCSKTKWHKNYVSEKENQIQVTNLDF